MVSRRKQKQLSQAFLDHNEEKIQEVSRKIRVKQLKNKGCAVTVVSVGLGIASVVATVKGWTS